MQDIQIDNLVAVDNKYGIGKVIGIDETHADVRFFLNITKQITETYLIEELQIVYLSPQTRVYVKDKEYKWKIGRVKDYDDAVNPAMDYLVRFPNNKEAWYASDKLEVRCLLPTTDPTEVLSTSGGESQYLYDSRKNVQEWLINLRASSRGLTALTSASIELVIHQVNIVRRILTDPIQRYLLADEVGMGKTIEAGIIARQCLLDSKNSKVLIVVPKHLVIKWEREMYERFYFNDFTDRFEITSPDNLNFKVKNPELIIIDEAHHIIGDRDTYSEEIRTKLIQMAKNSNKLLLLSATPGIGNEDILLSLLKVLDPIMFDIESLESFKEKVLKQSKHGAFLRTLKINQSPFLLKRNLPKITSLFPNDFYAEKMKDKILSILDDESKEEERFFLIKQLRSHLIETWRLHNRLIRTRRIDSEGWEFQDRGNKEENSYLDENLSIIEHPNKVIENINLKIEEWRSYISLKFSGNEKNYSLAETRYISLLETSNMDFDIFKELLQNYIENPLVDTEPELLNNILDAISDYNYIENIEKVCREIEQFLNNISPESIGVVFISDIRLAKIYLSSLQSILDEDSVYIFDVNNIDELSILQSAQTRIIICDKYAEEGVDLQFADAIIHLDLPLNPSRIEQRIGRLDRYGRTKSLKIQHLVILPTKDSNYPWFDWYNLLLEGFNVFHEPISDIQLKLELITSHLQKALFQHGSIGLESYFDENNNIEGSLIKYIQSLITRERESLDEQYALNHLSLQESESLNIRDELEDAEYNEKNLENDINYWLFLVLRFYKWKVNDKVFEIQWSKRTLIPKQQFWSKNDFITTNMWEGKFKSALDRKLSYYRKEAVENKDVSLLRPGHPLFTTLQHYNEWEDRGTTFSTFRVVSEKFPIFIPHGEISIMFKLHFIVESSFPTDKLEYEYSTEHHLYMRRTDDYFPPKIFIVHIDENLNIIDDSDITNILDKPYDKNIDTNLSSRRYIIDHFIDSGKLDTLCRNVSESSKDILLNSSEYKFVYNEAMEKVKIDVELKCSNIERRRIIQEQLNPMQVSDEYEDLILFEKSLIEGISSPNIKLDSFGMYFLSRFPVNELKDMHE